VWHFHGGAKLMRIRANDVLTLLHNIRIMSIKKLMLCSFDPLMPNHYRMERPVKTLLRSAFPDLWRGVLVAILTAGCTSEMTTIVPKPSENAKVIASVEGTGCGVLCIGYPPISFIPIGLNERIQSAYSDALSKAPGATGLRNVTLQEDWYWIVVGTMRYVTITGEAVK